jgi:hypothetical protein
LTDAKTARHALFECELSPLDIVFFELRGGGA